MNKGEAIASVRFNPHGDHLHFELWHWVSPSAPGDTDSEAEPVDPTRLLSHWEEALDLDYAILGSIDAAAGSDLDAATAGPALRGAYSDAQIDPPAAATISVLAPGCVWRLTGTDVTHLLRSERGRISVFEEAYGHRHLSPTRIDWVGITRRWSYPTFLVEAEGITYGVPLYGASDADRTLVDLARDAHGDRRLVQLEVRRSAFWRMDGSLDEVAAVLTGIRLGGN